MSKDLETLKTEIADESAISAIECDCDCAPREGGGWWYDTTTALDHDSEEVARALAYLDLRGLVARQDGAAHIVTFSLTAPSGLPTDAADCAARPSAAPDGYALVPINPTEAMQVAGSDYLPGDSDEYVATDVYRAMLAAAPQPPAAHVAPTVSDKLGSGADMSDKAPVAPTAEDEPVMWVAPETVAAMSLHQKNDFPAGVMGLACKYGSATVPLYLRPAPKADAGTPRRDSLVRPKCGCPFEEFEHRGLTVCIHADPGMPISAYFYDSDQARDLTSTTMEAARAEAIAWIDAMAEQGAGS